MSNWEPSLTDDELRGSGKRRRQSGGAGMVRVLIGVIVLLIVAGGGLGFLFFSGAISTAQPTTTVPTPTPRPTAAGSATTGAAAQQAAPGQPPAQPIVVKQATYGDWIYSCVKANAAQPTPSCSIVQTLSNSTTKHLAFVWRVIATDHGLVGEWLTPTDVMVSGGMVIDIGGPKPIQLPYNYCTTGGCQVQGDLAQDFVDTLSKATKANVTVFPINSKGTTYQFSVKGLADGLAALKTPPA